MNRSAWLSAALLVVTGHGAEAAWKSPAPVPVCMERTSQPQVAAEARSIAARMFLAVGVRLVWQDGLADCADDSIRIAVREDAAPELHPGALAFAMPYASRPQRGAGCEGAFHICVFTDRVAMSGQRLAPALLAHVLTHELTHVLQGSEHHATAGVMKAQWHGNDYAAMLQRQLTLTREDIDMLRRGVEGRVKAPAPQ